MDKKGTQKLTGLSLSFVITRLVTQEIPTIREPGNRLFLTLSSSSGLCLLKSRLRGPGDLIPKYIKEELEAGSLMYPVLRGIG